MDPRRFLILAAAGFLMSGCAVFRMPPPETVALSSEPSSEPPEITEMPDAQIAAISSDDAVEASATARPYLVADPVAIETAVQMSPSPSPSPTATATATATGRAAIAAANSQASAPSRSDDFVGGVQVFAWSPGRVFEVWTAPLRVTTLTLGEGETLIAKAAGDTVRWQIGEALSGEGASQRTHVLLKPLERGLETNLVLTTNRRVYLIDLKSGAADAFNAAIAWDEGVFDAPAGRAVDIGPSEPIRVSDPVVMPEGPLDARYRVEPQGRRPRWTPSSVFNDGRRTFITFDPDLQVDEAPALFVIAPDGEAQLVNYRQAGGLFIVDRVFDRAELRLGDRRPQVVRIRRLSGGRS